MQCLSPIQISMDDGFKQLVQCNHCLNCSIRRQLSWTIRICLEAQSSTSTAFTTLTYEETDRPGYLRYPDVQKFMKRLRKGTPDTVRFFCVGQFGTKYGREHWHVILFGVGLPQMAEKLGANLRPTLGRGIQGLAPQATELWPHGSTHIAELNVERARYAARYALRTGTRPDENVVQMSRKPGIGLDQIRQIGAYLATEKPEWDRVPGWWRLGKSLMPLDKNARDALAEAFKAAGGVILHEEKSALLRHSEARMYALAGDALKPDCRVSYEQLHRRELERGTF